jgi:cytochrome c oxidase subunit 1
MALVERPDHPKSGYLAAAPGRRGILSWILTTDHKRIGLLYLMVIMPIFLGGVVFGFLMRLELVAPGPTIVEAHTYNIFFTLHGVIIIFLVVIPTVPAIFGNFFLPIQIGAQDVAFPRLNLITWYVYISGVILVVLSLFTGGGPMDTGWTFYAPYSIRTKMNVSMAVLAVFVLGFSSILTGLNFITTIHSMRAPGMKWSRLTLFVWGIYATAWIQLLATPVVGITLLLTLLERLVGIGVFDPAKGGDPILYQHLFWIYSHPAVYIMILPGMGIVSDVIPVFSRKNIFSYWAIAISSIAIALLGSFVWGHHMFVSGQSDSASVVFSFFTFLVAIPSGVKVFNWLATMHNGSIRLEPPLLFALTFIFNFSLGGLMGLFQGALATDVHLHDTYFVVGHFHYVIFGGMGFAIFSAFCYWFPKMFGRMYNKKLITIDWAVLTAGFQLLYFPMLILGWKGMPRRYFDYLPQFHTLQLFSTIGSWILVPGVFLFFATFIYAFFRGKQAKANPWDGVTLEWTIPSPPEAENFEKTPIVTHSPYDFNAEGD